eukprot:TRINITY_DN67920_c0_g1_i1.p1 TRINITY_DN67920_c0_g1~~TRINITY_DN67920_c0_g1_i1.p1  ORF type:complete len:295 (+),score=40.49 TRINITY_DN67920_c0_g1_i1:37-885(+)
MIPDSLGQTMLVARLVPSILTSAQPASREVRTQVYQPAIASLRSGSGGTSGDGAASACAAVDVTSARATIAATVGAAIWRFAHRRPQRRLRVGTATRQSKRRISVKVERSEVSVLTGCTAQQLDALMATSASDVVFAGGTEETGGHTETVPGRPQQTYVFFPPTSIGPFSAHVRLTCEIIPPTPGRTEVLVHETRPSIQNLMTGKMHHKDLSDSRTQVCISWRETDAGLQVTQEAFQHLKIDVPMWFLGPVSMLEVGLQPFIERCLLSSQKAVIERLRDRLK